MTQAAFSRQFDSSADRGNADFDQRHNLVFYSIWDVPVAARFNWLLRGWKLSQSAAFRSGFPFTVNAPGTEPVSGGTILNNRADLVSGAPARIRHPVGCGFQVLSASAFRNRLAGN